MRHPREAQRVLGGHHQDHQGVRQVAALHRLLDFEERDLEADAPGDGDQAAYCLCADVRLGVLHPLEEAAGLHGLDLAAVAEAC